jgi:peptidase E
MAVKRQRIVAIGGGGFQMEGSASPIDDYLLTLTGIAMPSICLLSTASGDRPDYIELFHHAFAARGCKPSHIAFFERDPQRGAVPLSNLEAHLLQQDIVFVSGGNTRAAIAIWREWGVERILARALEEGVLLAGMSAGAMCWFEWALTDTYWGPDYRPVRALGFLKGGCRVHYSDASEQRGRLHAALQAGAVPSTIAITDGAAVLYEGGVVERVVTWQAGASAYHLGLGEGHVHEKAYAHDTLI